MGAKTLEHYIPLDKSWTIDMGVLDLLHDYDDTINFLEKEDNLGNDVIALHKASLNWNAGNNVFVGESGSLFRRLQFVSWRYGLNKKFFKEGTLATREICNDPNIIYWPLEDLLELDNKTSQWGSAKILVDGDWSQVDKLKDKGVKIPHYLNVTKEALKHWTIKRSQGEIWQPRKDSTIQNQAKVYAEILQGKRPNFVAKQAEDYCFAKVFKYKTEEFDSLKGHESNRIKAMEGVLKVDYTKDKIYSDDHRVVQAMAMLIKVSNPHWSLDQVKTCFNNPHCVSKAWPLFWKFMVPSDSVKEIYTVKTSI
tara:strand:+ start:168 stop:1094 length:927 start_codon:yes stop_codon:yes gene_type:complete